MTLRCLFVLPAAMAVLGGVLLSGCGGGDSGNGTSNVAATPAPIDTTRMVSTSGESGPLRYRLETRAEYAKGELVEATLTVENTSDLPVAYTVLACSGGGPSSVIKQEERYVAPANSVPGPGGGCGGIVVNSTYEPHSTRRFPIVWDQKDYSVPSTLEADGQYRPSFPQVPSGDYELHTIVPLGTYDSAAPVATLPPLRITIQ